MNNQTVIHFDKTLVIPNQDDALTRKIWDSPEIQQRLHKLINVWMHIEKITNFRWKATSFLRTKMAPSHRDGSALDIAPDISPESAHLYAVSNNSDPILYKREKLMRKLQLAINSYPPDPRYDIGVFVEPDHIHIGLFRRSWDVPVVRLFKWKNVKGIYPDSFIRSAGLGMIRSNV